MYIYILYTSYASPSSNLDIYRDAISCRMAADSSPPTQHEPDQQWE